MKHLNNITMKKLLTPKEFKDELRIIGVFTTTVTIVNWIKEGKIEATNNKLKINKKAVYTINRLELDKFKS